LRVERRFNSKNKGEVLAALKTEIRTIMEKNTRTNATTIEFKDKGKKIKLASGKPVRVEDENIYYNNQQACDRYDENSRIQNVIFVSKSSLTLQGRRVRNLSGQVQISHDEYRKQNLPMHREIMNGLLGGLRTFKLLRRVKTFDKPFHLYFNDNIRHLAFMIFQKQAFQNRKGFNEKLVENTFQEICTVNTRMCFDIDIPSDIVAERGDVLPQLLHCIDSTMNRLCSYEKRLDYKQVRICESESNKYNNHKVSYHIVILNEIFPSMEHQHQFTLEMLETINSNESIYDELFWDPESERMDDENINYDNNNNNNSNIDISQRKYAVDTIHTKNRAMRMPLCKKPGKNNTLIPMEFTNETIGRIAGGDCSVIELMPVEFPPWQPMVPTHENNRQSVEKYLEYIICIPLDYMTGFSVFSKARNSKHSKKIGKNGRVRVSKENECLLNNSDKKVLERLLKNVSGYTVGGAKVFKNLDDEIVRFEIQRSEPSECISCKRVHTSKGALFVFRKEWYFYCFTKGSKGVMIEKF